MDPKTADTLGIALSFTHNILWIDYENLMADVAADDAVKVAVEHKVTVGIEIDGMQIFVNKDSTPGYVKEMIMQLRHPQYRVS